jgi:hypothetical protein
MPVYISKNGGTGYTVQVPPGSAAHKIFREQFPNRETAPWNAKTGAYEVKGTGQGVHDKLERFQKAAQPITLAEESKRSAARDFIDKLDLKRIPGVAVAVKDNELVVRVPNIKAVTDVLRVDGNSKWVPQFKDEASNTVRGGYDKLPVTPMTMKVLELASHVLQQTQKHAREAIKVPHHDAVTLSTALDRDRRSIVVVNFAFDKKANDIIKADLEPHGLKLNKAAGGWVVPCNPDTAKVLAPVMEKLTAHLNTYAQDIAPSKTHPGIMQDALREALALPAKPGPEHAKQMAAAQALIMKAFSPEERDDLKELKYADQSQSNSERISKLSPEIFELAKNAVNHVETVIDHVQGLQKHDLEARHQAMQAERSKEMAHEH